MNLNASKSSERKPPLNICRCCLADDCYKDISTEYYWSGQKEVYVDMLKETFNIQISYQEGGGPSTGSRLICEDCISRLRNAFNFKETVLRSEENFVEHLKGLLDKNNEDPISEPDLKCEPIEVDQVNEVPADIDFDIKCDDQDFHDDASFDDDDEILSNIKKELNKADSLHAPVKCTKKSGETSRTRSRNKVKLKSCSKNEKDWHKIAERRGNGPILRENSLKLIANSTLCVFQWNKSRYRCFCCKEPFSDMNLLREHTNKNHTIENIEKKIIFQQNRLVKVEISTLFCKICGSEIENWTLLKNHLKTHNIQFDLDDDLLVPFKIDFGNLRCQICMESFSVFRLLNIHMNKHFQKQVCHVCGAGFSNLVFLNLHKTRYHRPFDCKECDLIFNNKIDKKDHDINVHNVKFERKQRFPCPYCPERFFQENFRVQHLVEKHGMIKPEFKCTMCSKVFITRSLCNNHVKNVHMKEKNHECDVCHHLFYAKSDVVRHMVTHTGDKKFSCSLCNNLFATKDSLRRHVKRTHVGVQ